MSHELKVGNSIFVKQNLVTHNVVVVYKMFFKLTYYYWVSQNLILKVLLF